MSLVKAHIVAYVEQDVKLCSSVVEPCIQHWARKHGHGKGQCGTGYSTPIAGVQSSISDI